MRLFARGCRIGQRTGRAESPVVLPLPNYRELTMQKPLIPCFITAATLCLLATPVAAQSQEAAFSQLLQSSPWCTFRYNKITGYSNSTRYRFYENGSYAVSSQGEGYSSGAGGTFSSQNNSGNSGRWAVRDGLFLMSKGQGEMGTVTVSVRNNSNGAPIIVADGVEYSQCR